VLENDLFLQERPAWVDWYACRQGIEVWQRILKNGCRMAARQLETAERLRHGLPLYSGIVWRIFYTTMRLSRAMPNVPCMTLWKADAWPLYSNLR
jgi:hypothetical protein